MKKITVGTFKTTKATIKNMVECLKSGRISMGKRVGEFEREFAKYHGVSECVAVGTGTAANTISLAAIVSGQVPPWPRGSVIMPALTFISCANSVIHAGLRPKFIDVDPEYYNMKIDDVEIGEYDKAILAVHLFGRPMEIEPLMKKAARYNVFVLEDCAEAHGARIKDRLVGTIGHAGTFSFYVAHAITTGEGGAIITNNSELAERLRSLRAHGRTCTCRVCRLNTGGSCQNRIKKGVDSRFNFTRMGYSEKMNEMEAIIGLEQIKQLDAIVRKRQNNMVYLTLLLFKYEQEFQLAKPRWDIQETMSPLCYPIVIKRKAKFSRESLIKHLEGAGIETRPMFGSIPTQQPAYAWMGRKKGEFPNAEYIGEQGFYVGCHQDLTENDVMYIGEQFDRFMKKGKK